MIKAIKILEVYAAEELANYRKAGIGNPNWLTQINEAIAELKEHEVNFISVNNCVMPSLLAFKSRRDKLGLSLREVTEKTGVSKATISRIENGKLAEYENVRKLHEFYASNGA